jgi:flagellar hook protein FlgE
MNHQVRMDVIGNNVSNVNTEGYKARRVTFAESFNQTMKGARRTESKAGGTNPMQVGLGVAVGSIDTLTRQGNLKNTGNLFDLAIEGNAFFGVSDGVGTFYTRNGAFTMDAEGYIILPSNGMVLQGRMADSFGNFPPGTAISNLQMPLNQQSPARETTEISLGRNLNADADAKGSIEYSQQMFHPADSTRAAGTNTINDPGKDYTPLTSLYNQAGKNLNIKEGDFLTITWSDQSSWKSGDEPTNTVRIKIQRPDPETGVQLPNTVWFLDGPDGFASVIEAALQGPLDGAPRGTVTLMDDGRLGIESNGTDQIFGLNVTSSNPLSNSQVGLAFHFGAHIGPAIGNYPDHGVPPGDPAASVTLLRPAEQFDYISDLRNKDGVPFVPGIDDGDAIDIFGSIGNLSIEDGKSNPLRFLKRDDALGVGTLLDDLLAKIRNDFRLPLTYVDRDGVQLPSVGMEPTETDELDVVNRIPPPGSIVIRGSKGKDFAINNLSFTISNSNADTVTPINFNGALNFKEKRAAQDVQIADVPIAVYDESGQEHNLTISFVHTGRAGEWEWKASFTDKEEIIGGSGTGKVTFGQDGTVSSWTYDGGGSQLVVDPRNGAGMMRISLDVGGPGNFKGITQFTAASTVNWTGQDGYPSGALKELTIDEFGLVEGTFTNGVNRPIAQIMLVDFANPGGLLDLSSSIYTLSANSGDPIWGKPKTQSASALKPGATEMSNVDLAGEFTDMITTQKGYQANSRIITVSDTLLEELVNLKR